VDELVSTSAYKYNLRRYTKSGVKLPAPRLDSADEQAAGPSSHHFSTQHEPFLVTKTTQLTNVSRKNMRGFSRKVNECKVLAGGEEGEGGSGGG
jgi:hypothetical protein